MKLVEINSVCIQMTNLARYTLFRASSIAPHVYYYYGVHLILTLVE